MQRAPTALHLGIGRVKSRQCSCLFPRQCHSSRRDGGDKGSTWKILDDFFLQEVVTRLVRAYGTGRQPAGNGRLSLG